jgi:transcriptional regulator with XRE-family HTH domain
MSQKFNQSEASELGQSIRHHRVQAKMTLVELADRTGVNPAQISRFENGQFKTSSQNLQIICNNLQINLGEVPARALGARLELFADRSERNRQAAEQIVLALESLIQPENRR